MKRENVVFRFSFVVLPLCFWVLSKWVKVEYGFIESFEKNEFSVLNTLPILMKHHL